ncbi:UDP-glucose 4-epimerase GalE [Pleionea litopenaei]|uniref:UDP-glucose 4-epimerase n=1 Tax=Pleionea litopenaei TaxID=3070815 RepID=A0AA51RTM6_9GAMM|nr:UDP-glucose 4-epimerase GalE [Pleionea sp. HL-JVS1]WMS87269.1 UDP-glucose 4-epimerase GalE [Pleionea sp. HL-JVS1]
MSKVLVTGGTGYIGSHTVCQLLQQGHDVLILDNLSNSSLAVLERIEEITNQKPEFVEGDIRDKSLLNSIFSQHDIQSVVHFAGLKAVGESNEIPLTYYDNNVSGTITLCQVMAEHGCKSLVFSSSATVYGDPASVPITESFPTSTTNPYGASKLMVENILKDLQASDPAWTIVLLRYFNPVGAHQSGLIGEDPAGIPNNLLPYVTQVAVGKLAQLSVFGDDYPTPDGTGVRDYIHVEDLAAAHVNAVSRLENFSGTCTFNLGTGNGYSVLDIIKEFEAVTGKKVPYQVIERRAGDIAECWADPSLANRELEWKATRGLEEMLADAWRWQSQNPNGYRD